MLLSVQQPHRHTAVLAAGSIQLPSGLTLYQLCAGCAAQPGGGAKGCKRLCRAQGAAQPCCCMLCMQLCWGSQMWLPASAPERKGLVDCTGQQHGGCGRDSLCCSMYYKSFSVLLRTGTARSILFMCFNQACLVVQELARIWDLAYWWPPPTSCSTPSGATSRCHCQARACPAHHVSGGLLCQSLARAVQDIHFKRVAACHLPCQHDLPLIASKKEARRTA